jgi:hypothetical protein
MTDSLTTLESLARAATPGRWYGTRYLRPHVSTHDAAYIAALSPERVLALIQIVRAADAMRNATRIQGDTVTECKVPGCVCRAKIEYDAARAAWEDGK